MIPTEPLGTLIDYVLWHARDRSLYAQLPTAEEVASLRVGADVKIGLESNSHTPSEHFWVEITEVIDGRSFVGKVQNVLQGAWGLRHGDYLVFCAHHIRKVAP
jgi:hypothetical protein